MRFKFVFQDWEKDGKSVYSSKEGMELSLGSFHSGTTFEGNINITQEEAMELFRAMSGGYTPVFYLVDPPPYDERLEPCPFCKKKQCVVFVHKGEPKTLHIQCTHCQYQGPIELSEEKAIECHNDISK